MDTLTRIVIHEVCHDESPYGPSCRHVVVVRYMDGSKHHSFMNGRDIIALCKHHEDIVIPHHILDSTK